MDSSWSALGFTQITQQFNLSRPLDSAEADLLAAINASVPPVAAEHDPSARYPEGDPGRPPILILALSSDTLPITTVDAYAETIFVQKVSQIQ